MAKIIGFRGFPYYGQDKSRALNQKPQLEAPGPDLPQTLLGDSWVVLRGLPFENLET